MSQSAPLLITVLPCFNEEDVLPSSINKLTALYESLIEKEKISADSRFLFVNDGSNDKTWEIIQSFHSSNRFVCGVSLAGNVGHQCALLAGMETAKGIADVIVTMDADLQDDLCKIPEMLEKYQNGCDIVYGVKNERKADSLFKRSTAKFFYKVMRLLGVKSIYNHADFRLMSKRAVEHLCEYRERNLYLRGIIPLIGYKTGIVYEDLNLREAGTSKYTLGKMVNLATDGITSFSIKPLQLFITIGFIFVLISIGILIYVLWSLIAGHIVAGWASIMLSLWFIGGCIMISLGILGLYVGKIYMEVKDRPRFNIEQTII